MSAQNQNAYNSNNTMYLLYFVIFLTGVFSSSFALAEGEQASPPPASKAQADRSPELQQGLKAFADLDYQKAETLFQSLLADPQFAASTRAQAALHLGIIALSQGAETKTRTFFLQALELDPKVQLDSDESPKLQGLFAEVKARMPKQAQTAKPDQSSADQSQNPAHNATSPQATDSSAATNSTTEMAPGAQVKAPGVVATNTESADTQTKAKANGEESDKTWIWVAVIGGASIAVVAGGIALYVWLNNSTTPPDKPQPSENDCQAPDGQGCVVVHF